MKAEPTTKALIEMLYERIPELFDRTKREWVGLTNEEVSDFINVVWPKEATSADYIQAIAAKLKEKNS